MRGRQLCQSGSFLSGSAPRETLHELQSFCAPPTRLERDHHEQPTTVPGEQLRRLLCFVNSGALASDPIFACCPRPGLASARMGATQRDVHGQLGTMGGRPDATTSMHCSSSALTAMFMSRSLTLVRTMAPAS